jgi:hypothetical protein
MPVDSGRTNACTTSAFAQEPPPTLMRRFERQGLLGLLDQEQFQ